MTTPSEKSYLTAYANHANPTKICRSKNCSHSGAPQSPDKFCKNSANRDGLNGLCKDCVRDHQQQRKKRNIERLNSGFVMYEDGRTKICSRKNCTHGGVPQPVTSFTKHIASYDLLSPECKTCAYNQNGKWQERNPDRYRESSRRYHKKNKEKIQEYHRNYHSQVKRPRRIGNWIETKIAEIKKRSEKRKIPFNLEPCDLSPLPIFCDVFGIALDYKSGTDRRSWASVDRIRPELGYVKGNVRIISLAANMAKFDGDGDISIHPIPR